MVVPLSVTVFQEVRCMEVRCGNCNKLFRIADEKISGSGIKFACSQCHGPVKITREDFENYVRLKPVEPVLPSSPPFQQPCKMEVRCGSCNKPYRISEDKIAGPGIKFSCSKCGASITVSKEDLKRYKCSLETAGQVSSGTEAAASSAAESAPAPVSAPAPSPKPVAPATQAAKVAPTPQPAVTVAKPLSPPREQARPILKQKSEQTGAARPAPAAVSVSNESAPSSTLRQAIVLALAVLLIAAVGYLATAHFKATAPATKETVGAVMSVEGLDVVNTSAILNANGDYVVSGDIVNATKVERPAWLVVAEVFDASGRLLGRARMLNGIELYTRRDYEILAKRGANIQELKARNLREQRGKLPPASTVHFEITVLEPPEGGVKFSANLQPFDPELLFKEITADQ